MTKAQRDLLKSLAEKPHYVAPFYKPYQKLLELGYVEDRDGRFSTIAYLTEAGRAALKAGDAK